MLQGKTYILLMLHSIKKGGQRGGTQRGVTKKLLRDGLVERRVLLERVGWGFQSVSSVFLQKSMVSLLLKYIFLSSKYSHLLYIVSSPPPKIRWWVVFKIWTKRGVIKNCSEIGGQLKGGFSQKGGVQIVSSVFIQKSMFSLLLEYFFFLFLSGKYSHLL